MTALWPPDDYTGPALWHGPDADWPVEISGLAERQNGTRYFNCLDRAPGYDPNSTLWGVHPDSELKPVGAAAQPIKPHPAAQAFDATDLLFEAAGVFSSLNDSMPSLAAAQAADVRAGLAALADELRVKVLASIRADILASDPAQQGALAELFGIQLPPGEPAESRLTDTANGERLANRYGGRLRYVDALGGYLVFDGRRYTLDTNGGLDRMAKETAKSIYAEAAGEPDEDRAKKIAGWAGRSLSRYGLDAMIRTAQSEALIAARPADFDANPWLLNCENGTVDLRTGELRPHDRDDHLTRMAPVSFDPAARCDLWQDFLYRIFDNSGPKIAYLQKAIGYTLTGDTSEQCLFVLHGTGANGKSVLIETKRALLGDYGQQAEFNSFMAQRGDGPRNDVARMAGARLVAAVESGEGRRLNESLIKSLTGGDTVTARYLHHEFFEFKPQFKLWLATNHKPEIRGTDNAIWRRIRLIPFEVTIPPADQDHRLAEKLRGELPGILAWAVRGCLAWQREGLGAPDEVTKATVDYRAEQDDLASFLADCCMVQPNAVARAAELHDAYKKWGGADGQRQFGLHLKERGFIADRATGGARIWRGVGLATDASDASDA